MFKLQWLNSLMATEFWLHENVTETPFEAKLVREIVTLTILVASLSWGIPKLAYSGHLQGFSN